MANPQPDKFTKLSNELYEAIMTSDFSKRQRKVLDLIIRMSYGCQKKYALIRPIDFELVGVWKVDIQKELRYLEKAKVIFRDGERIELNKNYDQWRISIVKSFDEERMKALIKRNLEQKKVSETLTEHTDALVKHLPTGKQNTNYEVSKILTDTAPNPSNGKGFERPKDILKTSKDINDDDNMPSPPEFEENSKIEKIKTHFSKKAQKIWYSSEEDMAMIQLLEDGVPVETILEGINLAFKRFKPKHSRDRINSFRYCLPAIYELHEKPKERERSYATSEPRQKVSKHPGSSGSHPRKPSLDERIIAEQERRLAELEAKWGV